MDLPRLLIGNQVEHVVLQPASRPTDEGWLDVDIAIRVGAFRGKIQASLLRNEFIVLRKELAGLYSSLSGQATLEPIEPYITQKFQGDGLGHINVKGRAEDYPCWGNALEFHLDGLDQTFIPIWLQELDTIIEWMNSTASESTP